jgi:DNA primase
MARLVAVETVRRYYRQDFWRRLRNLAAPSDRASGRGGAGGFRPDALGRRTARGSSRSGTSRLFGGGSLETPLAPASPQLQASAIVRGSRRALPAREAVILLAAFNHPWLLETEAEQLAELEFQNSDADLLRRTMLDITASGDEVPDAVALRVAVMARDCSAALQRIERAVTHLADWPARAGAAPEDVRQWWTHVLTLHRRNRTLNKALKEAERALGEEPSEQNFALLRDVQAQLASLEGTEATIEGFGALSGRLSGGP